MFFESWGSDEMGVDGSSDWYKIVAKISYQGFFTHSKNTQARESYGSWLFSDNSDHTKLEIANKIKVVCAL